MSFRFSLGWRQIGACVFLLAACSMIASAYSVVAIPLAHAFHPSRMVLMLTMTVMALVSGLLAPAFGNLMDRSSLRRLMLLGAGLLTAGFLALSLATSFTQVLVIYAVLIAPANLLIGPMVATVLLSRWFVARRGAALGVAISGIALGSFFYPPIIQALLDGHDWRVAFRLVALVICVGTVPAAMLVINQPADRGLHPDGADHEPSQALADERAEPLPARAILADPTFWIAAALFSVVTSGMKGMVTNLMPLALDEHIRPDSAALLISIYAACGFAAKLSFAVVADRVKTRSLLFVSLAGFALGAACLVRADLGYGLIAVGVGLIGMFGGIMVPMQGFLVPRIFGARVVGRAYGLVQIVQSCALLAAPPVFGLIFDLTGHYNAIFAAFGALAVVGMLGVPYLRLHPRAVAIAEELQVS